MSSLSRSSASVVNISKPAVLSSANLNSLSMLSFIVGDSLTSLIFTVTSTVFSCCGFPLSFAVIFNVYSAVARIKNRTCVIGLQKEKRGANKRVQQQQICVNTHKSTTSFLVSLLHLLSKSKALIVLIKPESSSIENTSV